jgi:hypothetical protein
MTSDDVPAAVEEQFQESVSFVVVLDLFQDMEAGEQSATNEVKREHEKAMDRLLEVYPSLEPTTEGFNPATIVREELGEDGILERFEQLADSLDLMEEWFEQRDEPMTLHNSRRAAGRDRD